MGLIAGIPTTKISKNHNWSQTSLCKIEFKSGFAFTMFGLKRFSIVVTKNPSSEILSFLSAFFCDFHF